MRQKGRVTGIVYVDSRRLGEPDPESGLALLEALSAQASIAVENSRLVAEEQRKTELMAILAHEIRNPLAGILGFASLSESEEETFPPEALDLFTRIRRDGERMKRLVDNILELARVEAGQVEWSMTPVVVDELLADVDASFAPLAAKRNLRLVVERGPTLPAILGSVDRLFQVLSNLIGNALKFTPSGGTITVRAGLERRPASSAAGSSSPVSSSSPALTSVDRDLSAWLSRTDGSEERTWVRFEVVDTGPGLPPDRRERLFEKFAQGDRGRSRGVGLGLYISREIVRHHGGEIWVEGKDGAGASFCFRLPASIRLP
jgi:signal transduction histidine kinase